MMKIVKNVPHAPKSNDSGELSEIFNHNNLVRGSILLPVKKHRVN